MRVRARITDPAPGAISPRARTPCAERRGPAPGRHRVDVSLTGEGDWHPRSSSRPGPVPVAGLVVRLGGDRVGRHTLRARATDAAGNVQPEVPPWNRLGYGNNAIEVIYVDVG